MERRKALSIAGVVVATLAAASIAMAANLGLLGLADADDDVGKLNAENVSELVPSTSTTLGDQPADPEIVVVEEYVTDPGGSSGSGGAGAPPVVAVPQAPAQPTPAIGGGPGDGGEEEYDEHEYDDDDDEYEEHEDEDGEDEEHEEHEEHEGDDDDD